MPVTASTWHRRGVGDEGQPTDQLVHGARRPHALGGSLCDKSRPSSASGMAHGSGLVGIRSYVEGFL
jgi:hypothetical protein